METVLRSEELPVADRFEWWREVTSRTLMPTEFTSDHADDFRASVRALEFGAVQVSVASYPSLRSRRTPALIRRSDPELYHLALTLSGGQSISRCRRDALVGAGDLLLYDSSHPVDATPTTPPARSPASPTAAAATRPAALVTTPSTASAATPSPLPAAAARQPPPTATTTPAASPRRPPPVPRERRPTPTATTRRAA
ncbi:hypothetical protein ACFXGR_44060 [Streptomyces mirabilis]|uniref:AraC-like ligand-binding domain-containing protein n=1 Tax=Streptomyces mirabilis TaxID=68239 RepID=UPI00369AA795